MPSFVKASDELFKKGVDAIICTATNDAYVMEGWGRDQKVEGKVSGVKRKWCVKK